MTLQLTLGELPLAWPLTASRVDNSHTQQYSHLLFVRFSLTGALSCHCSLSFLYLRCLVSSSPQIKKGIQLSKLSMTMGKSKPQLPAFKTAAAVQRLAETGLSEVDKDRSTIQEGPGRVTCHLTGGKAPCLSTREADIQATHAKPKSYIGRTQESRLTGL